MTNEEFCAILRSDFKSLSHKVFNEIAGNSEYSNNWHIDVTCYELMEIINGKGNKLIINVPPRHMKSIICSVALPAFILGHSPTANIICVTYSDDLAAKMALDCRKVIESIWYRELFPATRLLKDRKGISDFETTKGGGRFATSVGGMLTGRGGDIAIIDDPISPKDANSDAIREKTNDWYGNTLVSRLNNKNTGKIIVVMQRTHEQDFTDYLLEIAPSFKLVQMPAIAEADERWEITNYLGKKIVFERKIGEALHPERESLAKLQEIQTSMGSYNFAGQYQQNPTSRGGNIIKREWLRMYDSNEFFQQVRSMQLRGISLCQSWDTAAKIKQENDYSVCITYATAYNPQEQKTNIYILDVFRDRLEIPALVKKGKALYEEMGQKYRFMGRYINKILIEDAGSGIGFAQAMTEAFGSSIVMLIKPEHDKATRVKNIAYLVESGRCLFPGNQQPWWPQFEKELITFPNGKYDDQCDALSQLLSYEVSNSRSMDRYKRLFT
jgi:predicted phage terminase large subunit-like protein